MQASFSETDIERLRNRINAKKDELMDALKADKEFAYIKPLYQELKELTNIYSIVSGAGQSTNQQPVSYFPAHWPVEPFTQC